MHSLWFGLCVSLNLEVEYIVHVLKHVSGFRTVVGDGRKYGGSFTALLMVMGPHALSLYTHYTGFKG